MTTKLLSKLSALLFYVLWANSVFSQVTVNSTTLTQNAINVATTAIEDTSGNSFEGISDDTTYNFTTISNSAPSFTSSPVTTVDEGVAYSYAITTEDVEGYAVMVTGTTLPDWLTLNMITATVTVSTFAGSGSSGNTNARGTTARFHHPRAVATDAAGNVYVADQGNHQIRKISPSREVTLLAGRGFEGSSNGTGAEAYFNNPYGVAADAAGNIYVADRSNHRICKITPAGVVTTLAGLEISGNINGTGTAARFKGPNGVAVDAAGNVYVADTGNHSIRKITPAGVVTTLAGTGSAGNANGNGTNASFNSPVALAIDATGNIYVADANSHNIRKIDTAGNVTTLAGTGSVGNANGKGIAASFNSPRGLAVDAFGNIYVADMSNHQIRKIDTAGNVTTLAGTGSIGSTNGTGTNTSFNNPRGVAIDAFGNIYVADQSNHKIRKIETISNYELVGDSSGNAGDHSVVLEANDGNGGISTQSFTITVNDITLPIFKPLNSIPQDNAIGASITNDIVLGFSEAIVAGTGAIVLRDVTGAADVETYNISTATATTTPAAGALGIDDDKLYINPTYELLSNNEYAIQIATTAIKDTSGNAFAGIDDETIFNFTTIDFTAPTFDVDNSIPNDNATDIFINDDIVLAFDEAIVARTGTVVLKNVTGGADVETYDISTAKATTTPIAGAISIVGNKLYINPTSDLDFGTMYAINVATTAIEDTSGNSFEGISDDTTYNFTTISNSAPSFTSSPVTTVDEGVAYSYAITTEDVEGYAVMVTGTTLPDWLTLNMITATVTVSTFAGSGSSGNTNARGTTARFHHPRAVATDAAGNVYVADQGNHQIRKISPSREVTLLAGRGFEGSSNGTGAEAYFNNPYGVAADAAGNIYVADRSNHRICKITPAGVVTTLAGLEISGNINGTGTAARFKGPNGVAVDAAGNVYVADTGNHSIRKITPAGVVTTLAGTGSAGNANGNGTNASFNSPVALAIDATGNIYVADANSHNIRKIDTAGNVTTLAGTGSVGNANGKGIAASFNSPRGLAVDAFGNIYVADMSNHQIRKIDTAGNVTTLAGTGSIGSTNGTGTNTSFNNPRGVAIDAFGNIYVADQSNHKIRKIETISNYELAGDSSGNAGDHPVVLEANDGSGGISTQSFTITVNDITAPTFVSVNSTPNDDIVLAFSENIAFGTGNITIVDVANASNFEVFDVTTNNMGSDNPSAGHIGISDDKLYINPTNELAHGITYSIQIASTAIEDTSGNDFAGISVNFTTEESIVVSASTPTQNAIAVDTTANVGITFSKSIDAGRLTGSSIKTYGSNGLPLSFATPTVNNANVTFDFTRNYFPGEIITTTFTNAVEATDGSNLTPYIHQFTTGVSADSPANFPFGQNRVTTNADGAYGVYAADLNNDGHLDLLSASFGDNKIAWYANDGSGNFSAEKVITTNADRALIVYAADLDGDGNLDVLSASYDDDKIAWYKNDGSGNFGAQQIIGSGVTEDGASSVFAADLDGDGDLDVLTTAGIGDTVSWYVNEGAGNFGAQQVISNLTNGAFSVYAADMDNDGDLDVLSASSSDDKIAWYENDGNGNFGAQQVITTLTDGARKVYAADLDGDGDLDVLSGSLNDDKIAWYENDGKGNFGSQQVITTLADETRSVHAVDLDGDGDLDVISGSQEDDKVAWYENQGSGVFGAQQVISTQNNAVNIVYAADLDGDGDMDIVAASQKDDEIAWYENTEELAVTNITPSQNAKNIAVDTNVTLMFNGDVAQSTLTNSNVVVQGSNGTRLDFTTSFSNNKEAVINPTRNYFAGEIVTTIATTGIQHTSGAPLAKPFISQFTAGVSADSPANFSFGQNIVSNSADGAYGVYSADLDGDGDLDILATAFRDDKVAWYQNDGTGTFSTEKIITNNGDANRPIGVYAADLDNDGDLDVLSASTEDDKIAWYENDGKGNFGAQKVINNSAGSAVSVYAADLNGDGYLDVLSAAAGGDTIDWYQNIGNGTFSTAKNISTLTNGAYSVYAADIDNDGDLDILSASASDDKIAWYENDGTGTFGTQQIIAVGTDVDAARCVYAADFNGDGYIDVLSASQNNNRVAWYANNGDGTFGSQQIITNAANGTRWVHAADINGDGNMDVISTSPSDNTVSWHQNNGTGTFATAQIITTQAEGSVTGIYASDLDNDGDLDVIAALQNDDEITWYENAEIIPKVTSVTVPTDSTYAVGNSLDFTITFDDNVIVEGTPQLEITIGEIIKHAIYQNGTGTTDLVFSYTVQSGDEDDNGIEIGTLDANDGTLKDNDGNSADLTLNAIEDSSNVWIDGIAPSILSTSPLDNATNVADDGDFVFTFSEDISFNGNVTLQQGDDDYSLIEVSNINNVLTFNLNGVELEENTVSSIYIPSASIADLAGNFLIGEIKINFTTGDFTAPTFENSTPSANSITGTTFNLETDIDESGIIYYVVLADGATEPTAAEVKSGTGNEGATPITSGNATVNSGDFTYSFNITELDSDTSYDVYVLAEDDAITPNQTNVKLVEITTNDITPPTFENSTPSANSITGTTFDLETDINEAGTIYYVVLEHRATAPTAAEVKAGTGNGGATSIISGNATVNSGDFTNTFNVLSGLTSETDYDIYVVAEDDSVTSNLQSEPTLVEIRTLDITAPTFDNDTPVISNLTEKTFTLETSLDEKGTIYYVVLTGEATAPSTLDIKAGTGYNGASAISSGNSTTDDASFSFYFSISGLQSKTNYDVYIIAEDDSDDPNIQDSATVIQVTTLDLTAPSFKRSNSVPKNFAKGVAVNTTIVLDFNEDIAFGSGNITLKNHLNDDKTQTFNVSSGVSNTNKPGNGKIGIFNDKLYIDPLGNLDESTLYEVAIDQDAIRDTSGNSFSGFYTNTFNYQFETGDFTAPTFENSTPNATSITETSFNLETDIDESGVIYYVVLADGATEPTAAEVKSGTGNGEATPITSGNATVNSGDFTYSFNITALVSDTSYDVYVLAEDDANTPNQTNVNLVEVTTDDITPPTFENSTPSANSITGTAFNLETDINEAGTIYYVVLSDDAAAPTATEVKAGIGNEGAISITSGNTTVNSGDFTNILNVAGLTSETDYDIYVVAEDDSDTPNLQQDATLVEIRTLDITAPEIISFTRKIPEEELSTDDTLTFLVTFTEDVVNVDATDFEISGVTGATIGITKNSPSSYDVLISGGDIANYNGTVGLNLLSNHNIKDLANLTLVTTEPATDEIYELDNTAPAITNIIVPTNDNYKLGDELLFTLNFSEEVNVEGSPKLNMTIGAVTQQATYQSGTGTTNLVFSYTVQSNDIDTDGVTISTLDSNEGSIKDIVDNLAILTFDEVNTDIKVDGVIPTVSNITSPSSIYKEGDILEFTVVFNEEVSLVDGDTPKLNFTMNESTRQAEYANTGQVSNELIFIYNIQSNDEATNIDVVSLSNNNIQDTASNLADITFNTISLPEVQIDGIKPRVSSITVPTDGTYGIGTSLDFTVVFSEIVVVDISENTPQLSLTIGEDAKKATYQSGTNTNKLTFSYTILEGDLDVNGITIDELNVNNATINDEAGNTADLTFTKVTSNIVVDGNIPSIFTVSVPENKTYSVDESLDFTITFDESVIVEGTPQLEITIGETTKQATYQSGTGTTNLVFTYTVLSGDEDNNGIVIGTLQTTNENSLKDSAGNNADLTLNSVAETSNVLVDANAPILNSLTLSGTPVANAASITYTAVFNEKAFLVSADDFTLTQTDTAIGTIGVPTTTDNITWFIPISNITGTGSLRLDLNVGTDIKDNFENTNPSAKTGDDTHNVDLDLPELDRLYFEGKPYGNATSITFIAEFTEEVRLVSADDFTLSTTNTANGTIATITTENNIDWFITINNITGDGTLRLDLNTGTDIEDNANNVGIEAKIGERTYTVDNTLPVLNSLSINNSPSINQDYIYYTAVFSEEVSSVSPDDFILTTTGNVVGTIVNTSSNGLNSWQIVITDISGDGTLRLDLKEDTDIKDLSENTNPAAKIGDDIHTVDTSEPIFSESESTPVHNATNVSTSNDIILVFNEAILLDSGTITIKRKNSNSKYEKFDVEDDLEEDADKATTPSEGKIGVLENKIYINPTSNLVENVEIEILIDDDVITDINNNYFAGLESDNGQTYNFTTGDFTAPILVGSESTPKHEDTGVSMTDNIILQFNENIDLGTGNIHLIDVNSNTIVEQFNVESDYIVIEDLLNGNERDGGDDEIDNGGKISVASYKLYINPTLDLEENTTYAIQIDAAAIIDRSENSNLFPGIFNTTTYNFTTEDITPPTIVISDSYPKHESDNFVGTNIISIAFSENILLNPDYDSSYNFMAIVNTNNDLNSEEFNSLNYQPETTTPDEGNISIVNNVLYINPTVNFTEGNEYSIEIVDDAIQDNSGKFFEGLDESYYFYITNTTPPEIVETLPANNAIDVNLTDNIVVEFSKNIAFGTGNITITDGADFYEEFNVVTDISINGKIGIVEGNTLIINPTLNFEENTNYYVYIDETAIDDTFLTPNSFAGITNKTTFNFTTGSAGNVPFYIKNTLPADNTADASLSDNLEITFNNNIDIERFGGALLIFKVNDELENFDDYGDEDPVEVFILGRDFKGNTNNPGSGGVGVVDNTLYINPINNFDANEGYFIILFSGIQDLSGNRFGDIQDISTFNFSTYPTIPTIEFDAANSVPTNNAIDVSTTGNLKIAFSKNIVLGTQNIYIRDADNNGEVFEVFNVETDSDGTTNNPSEGKIGIENNFLYVNPTNSFNENNAYFIIISPSAITDENEAVFAGITNEMSYHFTTGEFTPPVFENSTPIASNITGTTITLETDIDEAGTVYYVVLADGATIPTATEVKAGTGNNEATPIKSASAVVDNADFTNSFSITGLSSETTYYVYVVAEDDESTPNVQASATLVELTTLDVTAPIFENSTPIASNITGTAFTLETDIDEVGTVYYVVLADGATIPTAAEVKAGTTAITSGHTTVNSGDFTSNINITGLSSETAYDVYVVAEDDESTPNMQASATLVEVTTLDVTAPIFENSTPIVSNITGTAFTLETDIDEAGTVYYVVLADGVTAPTAADVKAGTGNSGATPIKSASAVVNNVDFTNSFSITGLSSETAYDVYVVAEDDESAPNVQASATLAEFTTLDVTGPVLDMENSIPQNGQDGFSVSDNIVLVFNEDIVFNEGGSFFISYRNLYGDTSFNFYKEDEEEYSINGPSAGKFSIEGNKLHINATLENNINYSLSSSYNAITDLSGNLSSAIKHDSYNFIVGAEDGTRPAIDGEKSIPANNAINVSATDNIVIAFTEDIKTAYNGTTISIKSIWNSEVETFYKDEDEEEYSSNGPSAGKFSIEGNKLYINPSNPLADNTRYAISFSWGFITDYSYNISFGIADDDDTTYTFSVGIPDTTPPAIDGENSIPADNATNVSTSDNIVITFSEDIQTDYEAINGLFYIKNLWDTNDERYFRKEDEMEYSINGPSPGKYYIVGNKLYINPGSDLEDNTKYSIRFENGIIKDYRNHSMADINNDTTYNFTVGVFDTIPPTIDTQNSIPKDNAINVSTTNNIEIAFDEEIRFSFIREGDEIRLSKIDEVTTVVESFNFHDWLSDESNLDKGEVGIIGNKLYINPTLDLEPNTNYAVTFHGYVIIDFRYNPLAEILDYETYNFKTGEFTPPVFENSTPIASNITGTAFTLETDIDEAGTVYYVVLADGATIPTAADVKAGTGNSGATPIKSASAVVNNADYTKSFSITGLSSETAYDVYVVAEDDESTPNVQASATLVEVTTVDVTAPIFENSTPIVSNITGTAFTLETDIDEAGTVYYVVLADGAIAPTAADVKAGTAAITSGHTTVNSGDFTSNINITGLSSETAYDVYVVAEDDESTPNVQASATLVELTTLDVTAPVFENSTPIVSSITGTAFTLETDIDEAGTVYYVVLADGVAAPTAAEVKTGTTAITSGHTSVNSGDFTSTINITGLSSETAYDVYVVAEDDESTTNVQTKATLVEVTTLDVSEPILNTLTILQPPSGNTPANSNTVAYIAVFNEVVSFVSVDDFTLTKTGTADGLVTSVINLGGSGTTWGVTILSISGTGTLRLDLNDNTNIKDIAGNATSGKIGDETHTVDTDSPVLNSLSVSNSPLGNATSITYTAIFSEAVTLVSADDFNLTYRNAKIGTPTTVNNIVWEIPITNITGDGSLRLDLKANTDIVDNVGNFGLEAKNGDYTHTTDFTEPTFDSASSSPNHNGIDFSVTDNIVMAFSEDIAFSRGSITIYDITNGVDFEVFDVGTNNSGTNDPSAGGLGISGDKVYINPTNNLAKGVEYAIHIDATAVDDSSGNSFDGIYNNTTYSFTTEDDTTLSINENETASNMLRLYPNPASNQITLRYSGTEELLRANIINLQGQMVMSIDLNNFKNKKVMDIRSLNAGIYLMEIQTEKRNVIQKIVVK
ncbi:Ig-like domain-containing protein [Wenyingzhuangia sp. IMCC45574]